MAKTIPFNIKIRIDGKDVVMSSRRDVEKLGEALHASQKRASEFRDTMVKWNTISSTVGNVYNSLQNLTNLMGGYIAKGQRRHGGSDEADDGDAAAHECDG